MTVIHYKVVANTCASSRGNTWATSVIRLNWVYRMCRLLIIYTLQ